MDKKPLVRSKDHSKEDLLELAWGVIANASGGDWKKETPEWQEAAHRWGVLAGYRHENAPKCRHNPAGRCYICSL